MPESLLDPYVIFTPIQPEGYEQDRADWSVWNWRAWERVPRDTPRIQIEVATVCDRLQATEHYNRAVRAAPSGVLFVAWRQPFRGLLEFGFLHCPEAHALTLNWDSTLSHPWFRRRTGWDFVLHGVL